MERDCKRIPLTEARRGLDRLFGPINPGAPSLTPEGLKSMVDEVLAEQEAQNPGILARAEALLQADHDRRHPKTPNLTDINCPPRPRGHR